MIGLTNKLDVPFIIDNKSFDGEQGSQGNNGATFIPSIDADGNLSKGYIGALNAAVIESCIKEILP